MSDKKQTAVQLLIDTINKFPELATKEWILQQCEEAKHEEKKQIQDAYLDGYCETAEDSQDYYSKTYLK